MLESPVSWLAILIPAMIVVMVLMMRLAMKAPTREGIDIMEQIDGLQYYMEVVEEKILKTSDPPQMSRQLYEDYLPYAVALNVESKWADKFALAMAGVMAAAATTIDTTPYWYKNSGTSGALQPSRFSPSSMVNSFSTALSAASSSKSTSGGGRVGSGGGGGGGGGW
jgi:uncharacterized membrane protein